MAKQIRAVLSATDRASPTFARVNKAVAALGVTAAAVGVVQFGRKLAGGIHEAVEAYGVQEDAEKRLAAAIQNTGREVEGELRFLKERASALQELTGVADESVLSNAVFLTSLGASAKGVEDLSLAAANYAAGAGKSYDEAIRQVGKTLGGFAGELGEVIPEIKELSKEQLQAGEAARVINAQFSGQAVTALRTYKGRVEELDGAFGDLRESIGRQFADVIRVTFGELLTPAVRNVTKTINETDALRAAILNLSIAAANALITVAPAIDFVVSSFGKVAGSVLGAELAKLNLGVQAVEKVIEVLGNLPGLPPTGNPLANIVASARQAGFDSEFVQVLERYVAALRLALAEGGKRVAPDIEPVKGAFGEAGDAAAAASSHVEVFRARILTANEAVGQLTQQGVEVFRRRLASGIEEIETFGDTMNRSVRQTGVDAFLALGETAISAASGVDVSWRDALSNLFRDLGRAIARAALLRAVLGITGSIGGTTGGVISATLPVPDTVPGLGGLPPTLVLGEAVAPIAATPSAGGVMLVQHNDFSGASGDAVAQLAPLLEQQRTATVREIAELVQRGGSFAGAFR